MTIAQEQAPQQQPDVVSIVYKESDSNTGDIIAIVAAVIVVVLVATILGRFIYNKSRHIDIEQQKTMFRIRAQEQESAKKEIIDRHARFDRGTLDGRQHEYANQGLRQS